MKGAGSLIATAIFMLILPGSLSFAQTIDFENLPDGTPTLDKQTISDQYASIGVKFSLVDPGTGAFVGYPLIAKAGRPRSAFNGCFDYDLPRAGQGTGDSMLTDDTTIGVDTDLLIEYTKPVSRCSGVILDIDCRDDGGSRCEQWTITARDHAGATLAVEVLDGPPGTMNWECMYPDTGPGDAVAFGWSFDLPGREIGSILFQYTGIADDVGLAFDNFAVATVTGPPVAGVLGPKNEICAGQTVELLAKVSEGTPPFTYLWQEETSPGVWSNLGTQSNQLVNPAVTRSYRVRVTDNDARVDTSPPFQVIVVSGAAEFACSGRLLVSTYHSDRVLRYNPVDLTFVDAFVTVGSGGLDGPAGLDFGPDGNLYVASQVNHSVRRYDGSTGAFIDVFVTAASGGLSYPSHMVFGPDGNLYVASSDNDQVLRYNGTTGAFIDVFVTTASGGLDNPGGLVFGSDGNMRISSSVNSTIKLYDGVTGGYLGDLVAPGALGLNYPRGMLLDSSGDLYVANRYAHNVQRYRGGTGAHLGTFVATGAGTLDGPNHVAFGRAGNLFVTSYNNDKILVYGEQTGAFIDSFPTGNNLDGPAFLRFTRYCGDGQCDPGIAENACVCTADCGAPSGSELICDDFMDDDCDGITDCDDTDCTADPYCVPAARVPDDWQVTGTSLTLAKAPSGDITLSWGQSCRLSDTDYEIYEGALDFWLDHVSVACSTTGLLSWTLTPKSGNTFYLVAPRNVNHEGSYGQRGDLSERPDSEKACVPQLIGACN